MNGIDRFSPGMLKQLNSTPRACDVLRHTRLFTVTGGVTGSLDATLGAMEMP